MSYTKQNFSGLNTFSDQLNAMDDQIALNETNIGDLSKLSTTNKDSLVSAINEVKNNTVNGGTAVQSDWNQNDESSDDFIKNRTHYTEGTGPSLSKVIEASDKVMLNGSQASVIGDINQDITNGKISIDGNIYDFSVDKCFAIENYSICIVSHLSNPAISTKTIYIKATRLSNGSNAYLPVGTKVEIYLPDESPLVVHQLDEKYIPDSIARTSDIPDKTFVAIYGTTTNTEIYEAYQAGRDIILKDNENGYIAYPISISENSAEFNAAISGLKNYQYSIIENNWSISPYHLESLDNRSTDVGMANHNTYPTTSAVIDYVNTTTNASYYTSLSQAINDINNDVRDNAVKNITLAKVKVFTADNGTLTVMLLDNISESVQIDINKDIDLVLNGKTITLDGEAACLNFNTDTSSSINGEVDGSTISKTVAAPTTNCQAILVNGNSLSIDGGLYDVSGTFGEKIVMGFKVVNVVNNLEINNCTITLTNTDTTTASVATVIQSQASNIIIRNSNISSDTYGKTYGILVSRTVETYNLKISVVTRAETGNISAHGVQSYGSLKMIDSTIHADAICAHANVSLPYAIGISASEGQIFLENTDVTGTHSGVHQSGSTELYVDGGVLTGYAHGGIYACSQTYVKDATLRCGNYDGIFDDYPAKDDESVAESKNSIFADIYLGGTDANFDVYLDGCTLGNGQARWNFVIKETGNKTLNMSNCVLVNGTEASRLDESTHKLNIGIGMNIPAEMINPIQRAEYTGDLYRKLYNGEICDADDYNALEKFNDSLVELISNENGFYYSSLSKAITDINDGLTTNSIGDWNTAKVKVSTSDVGRVAITILKDLTETTTMEINKDIELILNGKTVNLYGEASYLSFNSDNSIIDGTAFGSTINKTFPSLNANSQVILVNSGNLTINNGTYSSSGNLISQVLMVIKVASTANKLELNNCTISNTAGTSSWSGSAATGIQSQAPKLVINNSTIYVHSRAKAYGLLAVGEVNIDNSNIKVITRDRWNKLEIYGIYSNSGIFKIKDCKVQTDASGDSTSCTRSVGILNYATMFLENTDVFGTYTGVMNKVSGVNAGKLYVSGGTLTGYANGGIFVEHGEAGAAYIKDAIIRCNNYEGIDIELAEGEQKFESTSYMTLPYGNFWVQGTGANIYFDGCIIDNNTCQFGFKMKGTSNSVYLSNSTISSGTGKISIEDATDTVYAGINTNASEDMFYTAARLTFTDELYRKLHEDEECNGADYNAYVAFLNHKTENTNSYILTSSTEGSNKKFRITIGDDGVLTATEIVDVEA